MGQSVNKNIKSNKCLIVLENNVTVFFCVCFLSPFFNIFCHIAQRYSSKVGGAFWCVWQGCCRCRVMGYYSCTIEFIIVSFIYSSLSLVKCPCQTLIHLIPWLSILTASRQKGQYFLWYVSELYNIDSGTAFGKAGSFKQSWKDRNMMYYNHMLLVGLIKISLFRHSRAYFKSAHKRYASAHTQDQQK